MWPWSHGKPATTSSNDPVPKTNMSGDSTDELLGPLTQLRIRGYGPQNDGRHPFVGGFTKPATSATPNSRHDKPLPTPPPAHGLQMPVPRPAQYSAANAGSNYPVPPEPWYPQLIESSTCIYGIVKASITRLTSAKLGTVWRKPGLLWIILRLTNDQRRYTGCNTRA